MYREMKLGERPKLTALIWHVRGDRANKAPMPYKHRLLIVTVIHWQQNAFPHKFFLYRTSISQKLDQRSDGILRKQNTRCHSRLRHLWPERMREMRSRDITGSGSTVAVNKIVSTDYALWEVYMGILPLKHWWHHKFQWRMQSYTSLPER